MKLTRSLLSFGFFGVFGLSQAGTLWATNTAGELHLVDTETAVATLVGTHGVELQSLALSPLTGRLFGADRAGLFYELNKSTGAATLIGDTGVPNIKGMDFSAIGVLFGFDFASAGPSTLYAINYNTGAASAFVTSDTNTGSVRAFAFDPTYTVALMATDFPELQTLHSMTERGVTNARGPMGFPGVFGMDFVGNELFGLGDGGELWSIDQFSGQKTLIGNTGDHQWVGASTADPVPEPATLSAIGLGLAALARRKKKQA